MPGNGAIMLMMSSLHRGNANGTTTSLVIAFSNSHCLEYYEMANGQGARNLRDYTSQLLYTNRTEGNRKYTVPFETKGGEIL